MRLGFAVKVLGGGTFLPTTRAAGSPTRIYARRSAGVPDREALERALAT